MNKPPAKMLTVGEVNSTFAEKGVHVQLPLPTDYLVRSLQILERKKIPGGVALLLSVRFINDKGEEVSELFHCEGAVESEERKRRAAAPDIEQPPLAELLPLRSQEGFENEEAAVAYLAEAVTHLVKDKGYTTIQCDDVDLCFEKAGRRFFVELAARCDDLALVKAEKLIALRGKHGVDHDYGLVIPAFQETLGVPLLAEERWILRHQERMTINRIGIYGVDNWNPNLLYAFSVHPGQKDLKRYFMMTGSKWELVRSRYVLRRPIKKAPTLDSPA
ncbi:MAG: hypothetical protein QUS33_04445 [Dehalococcoidia bacterium]|nr:hypothetical protein [Dehalococcoidia bacterium]